LVRRAWAGPPPRRMSRTEDLAGAEMGGWEAAKDSAAAAAAAAGFMKAGLS
jgi:hypothetical protein